MFFTPFAFVQQPFAVSVVSSAFTGYYIGGAFTTYASSSQPYFRMLDSSGSISSSFNTGVGFGNSVISLATQSDGKILVGGAFTTYSGSSNITRVARLNTNGTLDTSFNPGTTGANLQVNSIAVQADGKIVLGGIFSNYSGSSGKNFIVRANTNGTIDTGSSWNQGVGFDTQTNAIAIQSDQKIVVGGSFTAYSGSAKGFIVRLNTDGTADTGSSWNQGVGFGGGQVNSLSIQSDGKIIVGGQFNSYSGSANIIRIARLNTDGTRDTTFNAGTTGFNGTVNVTDLQSDGKVLVGGNFSTYSGSAISFIARLNTNGTLDSTFNTGTGFDSAVSNIYVQPNQRIIVTGNFSSYSGSVVNGIVRLNPSGTIDTTFNQDINIAASSFKSILQLSNGSIILAGTHVGNRIGYLTTINPSGSANAQSVVGSYGLNSTVTQVLKQSDGKLLVGGNFTFYSGSLKNRILRLNTDGTPDTGSAWNIGVGLNGNIITMTTQSDGKIIVGGTFTAYSGSSNITRIARLNTNGTRDTTFNPGTAGANGQVNGITVQPDGKMLVSGEFTTYSGSAKGYFVRVNTDGTADTGSSWNQGVGFNNTTKASAVQSDNKIIVVGAFGTYSGSSYSGIIRLNPSGTVDPTFNIGTGFNAGFAPESILIQPDGKIVTGGGFSSYSGSVKSRIVRLNTDGTADTGSSWNQGAGLNNTPYVITLESGSNKILVGGDFTTYSGSTANRIIRLNSNGTIDTTFTLSGSGGFNSTVRAITPY